MKFIALQHSRLVVSLFVLGMVFCELLFGSLCDPYGRRLALVFGLGLFCLGSVAALCADSFEYIGLARVSQGLGAVRPKIVCRTLVRDQFEGAAMALINKVFILAPIIAPAVG